MPTSLPRLTPARQSTVSTLGSLVSRARQAIQPPKAKTKREQQKEELFSHYVLNKDPEASKYMPYDEVAYPSLVRKARDVGELQESAPQELEHLYFAGHLDYLRRTEHRRRARLARRVVASNDYFGASVAIAGDTIVVGAIGDDDDACPDNMNCDSGSVYVFREEGSGGAAGAATASVGLIVGLVVAAAVLVVAGRLALNRFRSQSRASEHAAAADAEDIKLEAAFSDAADEMAAAEPSTGQKQAAP